MARICMHESVSIMIKAGERIPKNGTKGKVFVIEEFVSHEKQVFLCADRIRLNNLNVSQRDTKIASGTFEVDFRRVIITLDECMIGWRPYSHRDLQEELIEQKVVLL